MKAWAAERLSDYKSPVRIVAADELPRTGTNKVQRTELLHLFDVTCSAGPLAGRADHAAS